MGLLNETNEQYYLGNDGLWDSFDENYGGYQFLSLGDIVNNFIVAFTGEGKVISKVSRSEVLLHAKRGLQELSYDVLKSQKAIEIEVPESLKIILPQDYVNYIKLSWLGNDSYERIIYPNNKVSNPTAILQDTSYEYLFDEHGNLLEADNSAQIEGFKKASTSGSNEVDLPDFIKDSYGGRRYGLDPVMQQSNGSFVIDEANGIIHFSSNLVGKIIKLSYLSDGLARDEDMQIHKLAEDALYKYIEYAIIRIKSTSQEYLVRRFKKDFMSAKRTAKIRLSNIKIEELTQLLRGKSKHIKH